MRRSATKLPLTRADALGLLTARVSASFLALGTLALGQEPSAPDPFAASGAAHVAVSDQGTVELHVADMPLATVLQLLSLESKQNIVASPKVQGTVTANLYGVSFEEALQAILVANDAGYKRVGKFIYVYTTAELDAIAAEAKNKQITKVFHLNYVNAADAGNYVRPVLGEDAKVSVSPPPASGLGSEAGEGGGNMNAASDFIIVTARPSELREVERILKEIDVRPRQVLVEATILRATLTDDNSLGIDFTIVGGVDLELLGSTSTGIANLTLGQLPTERFEQFNAVASTDFRRDVPNGGFTFGIIKDHVSVFIRALEQVADTTVLANPKILALNRQKAQVIVGRRDGFLTTTVTETQAVQKVEFLETGTQLVFRPFIGNDGFVRLELHPKDSVGFVNAQGLPSEQTTEVTTNVLLRDNETIMIAGLFREVTSDSRSQVPFLGNLPGVGSLFRSRSAATQREEVIILLTVHIVKDYDAYAGASADIFNDVERMRVGLRKGMMRTGRDRIAQTHYHRALSAIEAGDRAKAIWHVDLALRNNARLLSAIHVKERLLGERAWDDDATAGRGFIHKLIANEKGYVFPMYGRPAVSPISGADRSQP